MEHFWINFIITNTAQIGMTDIPNVTFPNLLGPILYKVRGIYKWITSVSKSAMLLFLKALNGASSSTTFY